MKTRSGNLFFSPKKADIEGKMAEPIISEGKSRLIQTTDWWSMWQRFVKADQNLNVVVMKTVRQKDC